jgi:hypothetical protein
MNRFLLRLRSMPVALFALALITSAAVLAPVAASAAEPTGNPRSRS